MELQIGMTQSYTVRCRSVLHISKLFLDFSQGIAPNRSAALATLVGTGGYADLALEDTAEICAVGKANRQRDFGDAALTRIKQRACLLDAVAREQVDAAPQPRNQALRLRIRSSSTCDVQLDD